MEKITIDEYNAKCTIMVNGREKNILFCRNDYDITFIYIDEMLVCVFLPEESDIELKNDIRKLYDKIPIISMRYLDEMAFTYGMIIGMMNCERLSEGVIY